MEAAKRAAEQAALAVLHPGLSPAASTVGDTAPDVGGVRAQYFDDVFSRRLAFNVTIDTVPKYSATDSSQTVQRWISRVNEDAEVKGWTEHEKFVAAKRALTGAAQRWLDSKQGIKSWELLQEGLIAAFGRQVRSSDIHEILRNRKRKKGEAVIEYVQEMEFIASQVGREENVVLSYIANGFTANVHACASLATATSRQQFMTLSEEYDKRGISLCAQENGKDKALSRGEGSKKCYNCGRIGHLSRRCPDCYACGKAGRIASECTEKERSARGPSQVNHVKCACPGCGEETSTSSDSDDDSGKEE